MGMNFEAVNTEDNPEIPDGNLEYRQRLGLRDALLNSGSDVTLNEISADEVE